jgi:hypothetical protein
VVNLVRSVGALTEGYRLWIIADSLVVGGMLHQVCLMFAFAVSASKGPD